MKIPIDKLKGYIKNVESLGICELNIDIINRDDLPELYCLFISQEPSLVGIEVNESTQPRFIDASFKLQDKPTATLMLNSHI